MPFQKGNKLGKRFKKGNIPWDKGEKRPEIKRENHPNWKGGISKRKGYTNKFSKRYREQNPEKGRFAAKRRRARKKESEGSHTLGEWELLKKQYGYTCPCCGRKEPEIKLTEDHIIPLSRGGSDYIENIQPLCLRCNDEKHTKIIKYKIDYGKGQH